jgi:peptide/nickel transport system substrate-binding protein
MKKHKNLLAVVVFVMSSLLAAVACNGAQGPQDRSGAPSPAPAVSELVVAGNEIAISVDPTVYPAADYLLNMGAGEVLFKVDANAAIQPYLAKGATQLDEHAWEIQLRPEATFWSGAPVTAEAVIASLKRSEALDMKANPYVKVIEFTATGPYTLKAVTEIANLDVPMNLSYSQLIIHNTAAPYTYTDIAAADYTGMYRIAEFEPAQRMVFEKNEKYWGAKPKIQRVVHEQISDADARVLAALSGRYHVVMDIPLTAYGQFVENKVSRIVMVPGAQTQTIYLNTEKEVLSDYRVRQALSWGLDRDELILMGMEGLSEPVTTWLGSNPAYPAMKNAFFDSYNPEKAARLLDEAGWLLTNNANDANKNFRYKDGKRLTLLLRTFRNDKALGESIQIQWAKLGVDTAVQHGDYSLITTARETGDWDASIEAWGTFGNVSSMLNAQYASDGAANYGRYQDPKIGELLSRIQSAPNAETRKRLAEELTLYVAERSPALYICPRPQITAVANNLEGFVPHFRQFENVVNANLSIAKVEK